MNHKIFVIGLGSMGKRRIRNLHALGYTDIFGFDAREDRRVEVAKLHGIKVFDSFEVAISEMQPTVFVISVPPDQHHAYIIKALELNTHFFVEASVLDDGFTEIIETAKAKKIAAVASSTMYFHPAVKKIFSIFENKELGVISNVMYHAGQFLPDWHVYEKVSEFYVSQKNTGGAREIVPYELTWITKLLGFPDRVAGVYKKTIKIDGAEEIDDTYNFLMDYPDFSATITIDVVSRYAIRRLLINGSEKQLIWNWDDDHIKIFDPKKNEWEQITYSSIDSVAGYNKNISEQMYIDEMQNFFDVADGKDVYYNTMEYDHEILKLLYKIELSSDANSFVKI
ncbi:MAG: Gfo/Idh/MocA family oxidoreductase [Bacteroidetes bacterium]|nr:Gfo/Idh/MocA family oxidoreductase [Bacteroidota bacterium]